MVDSRFSCTCFNLHHLYYFLNKKKKETFDEEQGNKMLDNKSYEILWEGDNTLSGILLVLFLT